MKNNYPDWLMNELKEYKLGRENGEYTMVTDNPSVLRSVCTFIMCSLVILFFGAVILALL